MKENLLPDSQKPEPRPNWSLVYGDSWYYMSEEEQKLRAKFFYFKEHYEEATPEFIEQFYPFYPYMNNFVMIIDDILQNSEKYESTQTHQETSKKYDHSEKWMITSPHELKMAVMQAIQQLGLNEDELRQRSKVQQKLYEEVIKVSNQLGSKGRQSERGRKKLEDISKRHREADLEYRKMILPIYKYLRSLGYSPEDLGG